MLWVAAPRRSSLPTGPCGSVYAAGMGAEFVRASSQRLSIASNASLQMGVGVSMTLAGWVWLNDRTTDQAIIAKWNQSGTQVEWQLKFFQATGQFDFEIGGTNGAGVFVGTFGCLATNASNPATGTWHFVAARHEAAVAQTIRVNANAWITATTTNVHILAASADLRIGSNQESTQKHLGGRVDAVGLWKRKLTDGEVDTLYSSGAGVAYSALDASIKTDMVSWWELGEITGSTTYCDFHGTNHLTNVNSVTQVAGKT